MYMYRHLITSELNKSHLGFYISSLKVVGYSIVVTIKSKKYSDIKVLIIGESVNDILKQLYLKTQIFSKFYK